MAEQPRGPKDVAASEREGEEMKASRGRVNVERGAREEEKTSRTDQ